ncbi:hypothetical protein [Streptomyces sp. NPDC058964]|uniref:hypothetical protein n=1 Tax=Streptomyces sp. NPDC058964 TaxID=3346681 RepID=UPI0036990BAA
MTTPAPRFLLHPNVRTPGEGIWFGVPAGFVDLPLDALLAPQGSPRGEDSCRVLASFLASTPNEAIRHQFVVHLATAKQMFRSLCADRLVHCSLGLHRDDTGEDGRGALLSLFTIAWLDTAWAPRGVTAARSVAQPEGHAYIEYAELSCGPATFSESVRTPTSELGLSQEPLLQIHGHLPHPDGKSLVVLTLSTAALAYREHYRAILRQIAELFSFESPLAG